MSTLENLITDGSIAISVSVVSHAQIHLVEKLLHDIAHYCQAGTLEVILTLNLEEAIPFALDLFPFSIMVLRNPAPLGFAANHNQAFSCANGQFFCVINPDIQLTENPFPALVHCLEEVSVGVAAPIVFAEDGEVEDSARYFPTPFKILCKALGKGKERDYLVKETPLYPDWAAGMFLLFPQNIFQKLGGFDQRYFLYYEDVDICARLRLLGYEVVLCPNASVIHHAQRSSHRNFKYLRWHLKSMLRFFMSSVYWRVQCRKWHIF